MAEMSALRRGMIVDMTIRNLSPATQQSYVPGSRQAQADRADVLHAAWAFDSQWVIGISRGGSLELTNQAA